MDTSDPSAHKHSEILQRLMTLRQELQEDLDHHVALDARLPDECGRLHRVLAALALSATELSTFNALCSQAGRPTSRSGAAGLEAAPVPRPRPDRPWPLGRLQDPSPAPAPAPKAMRPVSRGGQGSNRPPTANSLRLKPLSEGSFTGSPADLHTSAGAPPLAPSHTSPPHVSIPGTYVDVSTRLCASAIVVHEQWHQCGNVVRILSPSPPRTGRKE